jgi:drug/metabolite transporter (DMT)-like permease
VKINDKKPLLAYLAICFFWGTTYLAIRIGVKDLPPMLFSAFRFLIAGIIIILYAKVNQHLFPDNFKELIKISVVGLILVMGSNGLLVVSEQWVTSGIASIIFATIPFIMTLIEVVILKQSKIHILGVIGLVLGFSGVLLLSIGGDGIQNLCTKGLLLLLLASLFWSIGSIYLKNIKSKCSMVVGLGIQMLVGGTGLLITGLIFGELPQFRLTLPSSFALFYLVLFGSIAGYGSYIYLLKKWHVARVSTFAYVNPVVAVLLGALILREPITPKVIISLVIILVGVILVQKSKVILKE